jgi:hypothetical protein
VLPVLTHAGMVAAITWDPFIRGVVILALFIILLPGSVYLVLSTNTGARLGFLLAGAGLSGMIALLAIMWIVLNSTADIGRANSWYPLAVVTGDFTTQNTITGVQDLPAHDLGSVPTAVPSLHSRHWFWPFQACPNNNGWHQLTTAQQTDAESAADAILVPPPGEGAIPARLQSPFTSTSDYVYIGGFGKNANGGCLFAWNRHKVYLPFTRGAHYEVVLAQPVIPVETPPGGVPPKPQPDPSKPTTYVILARNLGSDHEPQVITAACALLIFIIICNTLHRRDKEISARKEAEKAEKEGGGPPPRDRVGASV